MSHSEKTPLVLGPLRFICRIYCFWNCKVCGFYPLGMSESNAAFPLKWYMIRHVGKKKEKSELRSVTWVCSQKP